MATVMVIRISEMPKIAYLASQGDPEAGFRQYSVYSALPAIIKGDHVCLFCGNKTTDHELATLIFFGKEIGPGHEAIFTLVCHACDEADNRNLTDKVMKRLQFRPVLHEAGHA